MKSQSPGKDHVPCPNGNHVAGQAGSKLLRVEEWDAGVAAFADKIDDFNVRGQRDQINHPGWFTRFKFCTECGADLAGLQLKELSWKS